MDTNSYEWLQRCEAVSIIKRYIRTLWRDGEEAARHELQTTYDLYREVSEQRATSWRWPKPAVRNFLTAIRRLRPNAAATDNTRHACESSRLSLEWSSTMTRIPFPESRDRQRHRKGWRGGVMSTAESIVCGGLVTATGAIPVAVTSRFPE